MVSPSARTRPDSSALPAASELSAAARASISKLGSAKAISIFGIAGAGTGGMASSAGGASITASSNTGIAGTSGSAATGSWATCISSLGISRGTTGAGSATTGSSWAMTGAVFAGASPSCQSWKPMGSASRTTAAAISAGCRPVPATDSRQRAKDSKDRSRKPGSETASGDASAAMTAEKSKPRKTETSLWQGAQLSKCNSTAPRSAGARESVVSPSSVSSAG